MTGTDIAGTVDQLMEINARPQQRLAARNERLQEKQSALADLTGLIIGMQLAGRRMNSPDQFGSRSGSSSNSDALSVTTNPGAQQGGFSAQPLQIAATHTAGSIANTEDANAPLGLSGQIVLRGGGDLRHSAALTELNQGRGVQPGSIRISDRTGNSTEIDLSSATHIDQVIEAINHAPGLRVHATTVGDSIRLRDTSGSTLHNLRVDEVGGGETAADLGLRGIDVPADEALGHDIHGAIGDDEPIGLQGVPLSELAGGAGLGPLGTLDVKTSDGQQTSIDLSQANSTHDVLRLINDSGAAVEARLNDAGTGLRIRDLSGGNENTLEIAASDDTANRLGIAQVSDGRIIVGGDLQRRFITNDTPLAALRQGRGIAAGSMEIRDSIGKTTLIDLEDAAEATVGQLIARINDAGLEVHAQLNSSGDGLDLVDTGGGAGELKVVDVGQGTPAAQLGFTVKPTKTSSGGTATQTLSAAERQTITIQASDSLRSIADRINDNPLLATASVVQAEDGSFGISLMSTRGGEAGRFAITADAGLGLGTTVHGQDAVLDLTDSFGTRQLRSGDGVFVDAVPGVTLTAKAALNQPVAINVTAETETALTNMKLFVSQFNKLGEQLRELTAFDGDVNDAGLLFGTTEALRIQTDYARVLSGSIFGAGPIRSIGEVGLSIDADGEMQLDESRFLAQLANNSEAVQTFMTDERAGLMQRLDQVAERLAGTTNSMLISSSEAMGVRILENDRQIEAMQSRLDAQRLRLLRQFISAEEAIAKLQSNQSAIDQIQRISIPSRER